MVLQTSEDFVKTVQKSGLIPSEIFDGFIQKYNPNQKPTDLATALINSQLITSFQAEQLLQGKTRGYDLGRYRILKRLGGGSTGVVFQCEHHVMKHQVAIKVLSRDLIEQYPGALDRFRREARAASSLDHPNVVKTYDLDEDDGRHFLVMEYVDGTNLEKMVEKNGPLPIDQAVNLICQALQGLHYIHDCGLVHRDLKPGNLFLNKEGVVKILDLGLVRFTDDRQDNLTVQQGSLIMGSIDFMAPEQAEQSSYVDVRADIYSLGASLYYLLTGSLPLPEGSAPQKIMALQFHVPKSIRSMRPEVDSALEVIINKMMSKNPVNRYSTPELAFQALQRWLQMATAPKEPIVPLSRTETASPMVGVDAVRMKSPLYETRSLLSIELDENTTPYNHKEDQLIPINRPKVPIDSRPDVSLPDLPKSGTTFLSRWVIRLSLAAIIVLVAYIFINSGNN